MTDRPFIAEVCICCESPRLQKSPAVLMPFLGERIFGWRPVRITEDWGMRTLETGMAYPLCNSVRCADCAHLFLDMRFSDDQMKRLYHRYQDADYAALRATYEPDYLERNARLTAGITYLDQVERFLAPFTPSQPRILDWGGGRGRNTPFSYARALHHVYDIADDDPVAGAQMVDRETALSGGYDLMICSNVLEHLPYPMDTLEEIAQAAGPKTVVYFELPYENVQRQTGDAPEALALKRHWHEHINFFSRRSVEVVLQRAGFEVIAQELVNVLQPPAESYNFFIACRKSQP